MKFPKKHLLTFLILLGMLAGVAVGEWVYLSASTEFASSFAQNVKLLTTIFLRLIQMILAPLVLSTLIVGIAKMGDIKSVGRVGGKSMLWFFSASLISLFLGLILVNFFEPGVGIKLSNVDTQSASELVQSTHGFSIEQFIQHVFPKSIVQAMAENEILQIVIFSIIFGLAMTSMGEKAKPLIHALDVVGHICLKMVTYIMWVAPLGVFGGVAAIVAKKGLGVLKIYGTYIGSFYTGLAVLWAVLLFVGFLILGKRLKELLKRIQQPLIIAFSTTSSESVFPKLTEELERFGNKPAIVNFVLPLGYSFNLDGSMMYMTFASIFIAQAYDIPLDLGTQITMLFVLMLTSKGIAGVPRASLVVVTATCAMFNIPPEGIALILPIDHFCDMGRSMTNVLGNALATSAVNKWETKS